MSIDAVVFDLGGVLNEYRGVAPMLALSGIDDEDELWRRWLSCEWVRAFERGHCSAQEFADGVVSTWPLRLDADAFLANFGSWVVGPFEGADRLLATVAAQVPVSCLSNTNAVHWGGPMAQWPLMDLFEQTFLSFELGMVKPDREIFEHVVGQIGVQPARILFLDDNLTNVLAARESGLRAERVQGVDEATQALRELGLVPL
jgi:FMN phosphatase YigB (HAD superfamily)